MMRISLLLLDDVSKKISVAFLSKVLSSIITFIFSLVISRELGAKESGVFFTALTLLFLLSIFSRLGLENYIVRINSISWKEKSYGDFYGKLIQSVLLSLIVSIIIIALVLGLVFNYDSSFFYSKVLSREIIFSICIALIPFTFMWLLSSSLKSIDKAAWANFFETGIIPLVTLFFITIIPFMGFVENIEIYFTMYSFACFLGMVFALTILVNNVKYVGQLKFTKWRELLSTSHSLLLFSLSMYLLNWGGVLLLGIYGYPQEAGQLNAANRVLMFVNLIVLSFSSILTPKLSTMFYEHKYKDINKVVFQYTKLLNLILLPFLLLVAFFSEKILTIFGEGFSSGSYFLWIIAMGQIIFVFSGLGNSVLISAGKVREIRNFSIVISIFYLIILSILIPTYGGVGAAIGISVIYGLQGGGMIMLMMNVINSKINSEEAVIAIKDDK